MNDEKIKILIVEDSRVTRDLIKHLLSINPHVEITGTAENGVEALEFIKNNKPDVVLTDIVMPKMNGFELTKKIMETNPIPVIVMSGVYSADEIRKSFDAFDAGAVAILEKPHGIADESFANTAKFIFDTARLLSSLRGFNKKGNIPVQEPIQKQLPPPVEARIKAKGSPESEIKAVAIGSSIGGPKALQVMLTPLPQASVPIFVVQHISPGFVQGFANWLNDSIALNVKLPANGEDALPGTVYIAPDRYHMEISPLGKIILVEDKSQGIYVPSVGRLFQSVVDYYGSNSLAVMLLGAEKDGAKAFQNLKNSGALAVSEVGTVPKNEPPKQENQHVYASINEISNIFKELI